MSTTGLAWTARAADAKCGGWAGRDAPRAAAVERPLPIASTMCRYGASAGAAPAVIATSANALDMGAGGGERGGCAGAGASPSYHAPIAANATDRARGVPCMLPPPPTAVEAADKPAAINASVLKCKCTRGSCAGNTNKARTAAPTRDQQHEGMQREGGRNPGPSQPQAACASCQRVHMQGHSTAPIQESLGGE